MIDLLKRILSYAVRNSNGCLIIENKALDKDGYPRFELDGRTIRANRLIFHIVKNYDLDSKTLVLHAVECNSRACIEVNHLREGNQTDNMNDMMKKGTQGGQTLGELQKRKTHCPKGHPYEGRNLIKIRGKRYCRQCINDRAKAYRKAKNA